MVKKVTAYDAGYRSYKRYHIRKAALEEAARLRNQGYNARVQKMIEQRTGRVDYLILIRKRKQT